MENRGSEDDEMFGGVWQAMEASIRKTKMREKQKEEEVKEEAGRKREEKERRKTKEEENNRCEESSKGVGNLG